MNVLLGSIGYGSCVVRDRRLWHGDDVLLLWRHLCLHWVGGDLGNDWMADSVSRRGLYVGHW